MAEERVRVLLLDDEESLRVPLKKYLEDNFGYRVDAVASGEEALEQVEKVQGHYDVALIDEVLLRQPDGIEVTQQIKAGYPDIECIVFTGWGTQSRQRALRAGAFRYMEKPFDNDELAMLIRTAAQQVRLREIGRAILSERNLDRVLESIAGAACSLALAEDASIALLERTAGKIAVHAKVGPGEQVWTKHFKNQSLSKEIIRAGQIAYVPDTTQDDRVNPEVIDAGIRSFLGLPIPGEGRNLGVLYVYSRQPGRFDEGSTVAVLQTLAGQAGLAIANAKAFGQLRQTKEQLDALIENSFDAIIAIDQDRKVTVFNRRAEEMFGWTREEMLSQSVARLHVDIEKAREIFETVNRQGTVASWNVDLKHRDGTRIPALLSATLIRDSQGKPIGQAGFMRDLRQMNLLEERLQALIGVSQAITGTLQLDEVLNIIAESVITAFPTAKSSTIHLYDRRDDLLHVRACTRDYSPEAIEALNLKIGEGIAGWVFQHQQPLVVPDTRQAPQYKWIDHPEVQVHRSMICVPLRVKGQTIGALSLNSGITNAFQPEDLGLLSSFADQAAIAIDNARRVQELEQMRQAAEAMSRVFEPRQALQQIVESAAQVLGTDSAAIWSYDEVRDIFIPEELVAVGIPSEELERFREEEPKPGRTADTVMCRGYVPVTDITQPEYDFLGQPTRELLNRIGVRSFQGIALQVGDERLGVLYTNYKRLRSFGEEEERKLRTFASHAALALKNARLLAQMQRTKEAAGVIAGVTLQEDLTQTLKTIARHAQQVLSSDVVTLYSYDEVTGQFGEWATEIRDPRKPDSARPPEKLMPDSVVWSILNLSEPPYYRLAEDHAGEHALLGGRFVRDEGMQAAIGVQLRVGERKVGVMFVNFRSPHRFTADEIATIQLFADQAAVAIRNARQYDEIVRDARLRQGLLQAGREIMALQKPEDVLQNVVHMMHDVLACDVVTLYTYDQDREEIGFPAYVAGELRDRKSLDKLGYVSKDSVVGKLLASGQPHFADHAPDDPVMSAGGFVVREGIKSSAGIPLKFGERVIGVVFVNYRACHPFPAQEQEALLLFATQAAVAIQNARQYYELEKTKEALAAQTSVSWIGMISSAWRHAIEKHALTIREQTQLLRREVQKPSPRLSYTQEKLDTIERLANQILEKPITPPLTAEEGVTSVPVNEFIRERTRQLWTAEPYKSVPLCLDLGLEETATVRASPDWLRRSLDILVDNAVEAMSDISHSQIVITSRSIGNQVEIAVADVGKGIPEEVKPRLFREPIPKPKGARGLGLGLLIAQTIVRTYGGEIRLSSTGPTGTTMVISLPLEK